MWPGQWLLVSSAAAWTVVGTGSKDVARAVQVSSSDEVLVVGDTSGGFDGHSNKGDSDIFAMKFGENGTWLWTRQRGGRSYDLANSFQLDVAENWLLAGYTGSGLDGNFHAGADDLYVMKLSPQGAWLWTAQRGTGHEDRATALQALPSGEILVAGHTKGSLDGNRNLGDADIFLMQLSGAGRWRWTRQLGSARFDGVTALRFVEASDQILVAGFTLGSMAGFQNAGGEDVYVMALTASGEWLWSQQRGTLYEDRASAMVTGPSGEVFLTGHTKGSLDGNANRGEADVFLMKLDASGAWQWTKQRGSSSYDSARALQLNASGLLVAGYTQGAVDGNAKIGVTDILVMLYDVEGEWQWTQQGGSSVQDYAFALALDSNGQAVSAGTTGSEIFVVRLPLPPPYRRSDGPRAQAALSVGAGLVALLALG